MEQATPQNQTGDAGKRPIGRRTPQARLELAVNEDNKLIIFHNRPFRKELSWLEFDIGSRDLVFVFGDGEMQELGLQVPQELSRHMHNTYQVLVVEMDDETGEPVHGDYFPVILHET